MCRVVHENDLDIYSSVFSYLLTVLLYRKKYSMHDMRDARQVLRGEDWRRKSSVLRQIREQLAAAGGGLPDEEMRELAIFMV